MFAEAKEDAFRIFTHFGRTIDSPDDPKKHIFGISGRIELSSNVKHLKRAQEKHDPPII
jgi:hypothetical protein